MSMDQFLGQIGLLLNEIGPKSEGFERGQVYIECGPMQWSDGTVRGKVYGPYKTADECHNYVAVKRERHRLANAKFHGEEGRPPVNDREYMGHPSFQYRIMPAEEYFSRYLLQIQQLAGQGLVELFKDEAPEVFWPSKTGGTEELPGLEDGDEWTDEEEDDDE